MKTTHSAKPIRIGEGVYQYRGRYSHRDDSLSNSMVGRFYVAGPGGHARKFSGISRKQCVAFIDRAITERMP